jgi:YgiT-type zinc finger domain-containing protein
MLRIQACPSCGSGRIRPVRRNWSGEFRGRRYTVPQLRFFECPACGEKVFEPEAMRRIESKSPAFAGARRVKKLA